MKGMSSYTWMTFGILLSVFSKVFSRGGESKFYTLFFYIGIAFFAIGVLKLLYHAATTEKKEKHVKHHKAKPHKKNFHSVSRPPTITHCTQCGTKNHTVSKFCHMCGATLTTLPK